jgi:hypothetical protein
MITVGWKGCQRRTDGGDPELLLISPLCSSASSKVKVEQKTAEGAEGTRRIDEKLRNDLGK